MKILIRWSSAPLPVTQLLKTWRRCRFFIKDYGILAEPPPSLPGVDTNALPYSLRRFALEHPDRLIEAGSYCGSTLDGSAPGLRVHRMHSYDEDEDPDPLVVGTIAGDPT